MQGWKHCHAKCNPAAGLHFSVRYNILLLRGEGKLTKTCSLLHNWQARGRVFVWPLCLSMYVYTRHGCARCSAPQCSCSIHTTKPTQQLSDCVCTTRQRTCRAQA